MLRNMFFLLSLVICVLGLPVNTYFNLRNSEGKLSNPSDSFKVLTPTLVLGPPIAAHVVMGWMVNITVLYFLWANFKKIIQIRRRKFMTNAYQYSLSMRSLLVTEIPANYLSVTGLADLITSIPGISYSTSRIGHVEIGRDVKELAAMHKKYKSCVIALEKLLAKYLRNPDKLPSKRPFIRPMKEDRGNLPRKVDAINYYVTKLKELKQEIYLASQDIGATKELLPYGFVSYKNQIEAHVVAKRISKKKKYLQGAHVRLAPKLEDIIWKNLVLGKYRRAVKQGWGILFFLSITILWIVPNAFITCFLSDLSRLGILWPAFAVYLHYHPTVFAAIQGVASPILTAVVFSLIAVVIRRMSQWQGQVTKNERERDVTKKLYSFFFFNNLFIFSLLGVIWSSINYLVENRHLPLSRNLKNLELGTNIAEAIINGSSFWIIYLLQANLGAIASLLQILPLFWIFLRKNLSVFTPRDEMLLTAPLKFNYAIYYVWLFFYSTIALALTSTQPLIYPMLTFYLSFDLLLKKYSLMYMFVTKTESDGMYWPFIVNCMLFALVVGNVVLFIIVWVNGGWGIAMSVIPLPIIVIGFKIFAIYRLNPRFYYFFPTMAEQEAMNHRLHSNRTSANSDSGERYRNPIVNERLPVPMVHVNAQHKLAAVCHLDDDDIFNSTSSPMQEFDRVKENELNYSDYALRNQGRRQQSDQVMETVPLPSVPTQSMLPRDTRLHSFGGRRNSKPVPNISGAYFEENIEEEFVDSRPDPNVSSAGIIQDNTQYADDDDTAHLLGRRF